MVNEPDIIKQLREAERCGTLKTDMQQPFEKTEQIEYDEEQSSLIESNMESKGFFDEGSDESDTLKYSKQDLYKSVVELSPDGIFVLDLKGVVLSCNDAAMILLGYSKEELIGHKFSDIGNYSRKDITRYLKLFFSIIKGKKVEPFELDITRKNGMVFTAEIRVSLLEENGRKKGIQAVVRDVTEQKISYKRIQESEEKYRALFENMPNGFAYHQIITDNKGKPVDYIFLEINESFEKQTGLKREQLIGKRVTDVIPGIEKDPAGWIKKYGQIALQGGELHFEQYAEPLETWYQVYVYSPKEGFFVTIFEDISERKKSERELFLKDKGIGSALSPIAMSDLEGTITYVNQSFLKLWKYEEIGEILGEKVTSFWENAEDASHVINELMSKGVWSGELSAKTNNGNVIPVKVFANIINDDKGKPIAMMSSFLDMADQKKYQMHLVEKRNYENIRAKIWEIAAKQDDENAMIQSLVDTVGPFLGAENTTFMRLDEEREYLNCEIQWRKDGTNLGLGENVPFHVFKRIFGKPFYSFSIEDIPTFAKPIIGPIMKKYGTKSSLIVPYGDMNDPKGYLTANTYSYSKKFTDEEIQILTDAVNVISLKTSQLKAHEQLQKNEKILQKTSENQKILLDNIQTQVWFLIDDHTYGDVNKAHAEFNGLKKEDLAFKDMYDIFSKDIVETCREGNLKVFKEKKSVITEEWVPHASGEQKLIRIFKNPKFDEHGNVEYVVCSAEDITEQRKAESGLKERLKFEHLITQISSKFVDLDQNDKDEVIDATLGSIGQLMGVDRAYMFLFDETGKTMSNTNEWCADNINPEIENLKNISIDEGMPWFSKEIQKGEIVQITDINTLPDEAKLEYQHFKAQDIKSLIVTPLRTSDSIIGFIGFDAVSSNRMWSVDDQSILHLVSEIISHALERIKADEMLQKSERKYRSIINNMQDVYYRADIQGNLELISPSALKLFGYESMDAIIGMNISKDFYADPEQRDIFLDMLKKNGGSITNYEVELKKKDGSVVTVITSSAFHYDDQGNIQGVEGIFSDITERKKIEDALISSENNFRTFFETVDDLIFIGNQLGEIIYTNSAVSRKLGYTKEELTTKHVLDVHPSEKRSEAEKIFADMFAGKRNFCPLPLQAKDGKYLPVETRVWFGKWDGRDCIFGVSKDLSEQHAALEKFHKLFDNNPALMALSSLPGREFIEVNESFIEKLGYSREDIVGKTAGELELFIEEDKQIEVSRQLQKYGFIKDIELKVRSKDGQIIDGMFSGEIIDTQNGKSFLTVMTDITDRKRAEEEAKRQIDKTSLLNTIISEGIKAKNLSKYLEKMLDVVLDKIKFDAGGVYLVDSNRTEASVVCSKNINDEFLNMIQRIKIDENPMYMKLFRDGEIIFVDDYAAISQEKAKISGFNSNISIPVELDGEVIGALNLARIKSTDFKEFDMNLAKSVADQIGSVIRRLQFEEELKEKIDELERWKKVTVGRELRIRELKDKIKKLEAEHV